MKKYCPRVKENAGGRPSNQTNKQHAVGKSGWFFLLLVQSLIKIYPCGPYKRRGNMHQNTQLERKGLQSLGIDMLIVISCRIFKDILTFVDVTRHIYLLPRRTHRTITFFICSSKFFDSQGIELVNNEIAINICYLPAGRSVW